MTFLYIYGFVCIVSIIIFLFAIRNAEPYPEELEKEEDAEFIKQIEEYKKRQ